MDGSLLPVLASVLILVGIAYGIFTDRGGEVGSHSTQQIERFPDATCGGRPVGIRREIAAAVVLLGALAPGCATEPERGRQPTRTVTIDIGGGSVQFGDQRGAGAPAPESAPPPDVPGGDSCEGADDPTTAENLRKVEIALRCLTNAVRREKGLRELRFDERLARAAATRSSDMADANFFGHYGPGNSSVRTAVRRTGWIPRRASWFLGENIAWAPQGSATPADLMRSWLDSPTHRANILSKDFSEIGIGGVAAVPKKNAEPGATLTQIFGVQGKRAREAQT